MQEIGDFTTERGYVASQGQRRGAHDLLSDAAARAELKSRIDAATEAQTAVFELPEMVAATERLLKSRPGPAAPVARSLTEMIRRYRVPGSGGRTVTVSRPMFWYVTHPSTGRAFFHEDDASALTEISQLFPDRSLSCEPSLEEAGKALGYRIHPLTPFQASARATLWVGAELPDWWRGLDPVAGKYILEYASRLWQRQPEGELIIELAVSAKGGAVGLHLDETVHVAWGVGSDIFAFDSAAALREFQESVMNGDLAARMRPPAFSWSGSPVRPVCSKPCERHTGPTGCRSAP